MKRGRIMWIALLLLAATPTLAGEIWLEWSAVDHPELEHYLIEGHRPDGFLVVEVVVFDTQTKITDLPCEFLIFHVRSVAAGQTSAPSSSVVMGFPTVDNPDGGRMACIYAPFEFNRTDL